METTLKLSTVLSLLSVSLLGVWSGTRKEVDIISPTCYHFECPTFDVIDDGDGYEIRRYNSTVWISNPPIQDNSLVQATTTASNRLFAYIHGNNNYKQNIKMTAPVITEVLPNSSFGVSLFVPKENQANPPPPANDLNVQRWKTVYAAVRSFSGSVIDSEIGNQAAALNVSIATTKWSSAIEKSHGAGHASIYTVAQYNSPFDINNRLSEIWFLFDIENVPHSM